MDQKLRQPGIFGQLCLDNYTVIVLGFADRPGTSRDAVLNALDSSALKLLEAYPSLAGQVVNENQSATSSGTYSIVPYPPHQNKSPVRRKDCTKLCPSYQEILDADAPFAMLDGDVLSPVQGMGYQYPAGTELPVLIIQANFIEGGLLLCFSSMHNALDMNGQGIVLKMFAAAGRGEQFDPVLVAAGNRNADKIVPLLRPDETQANHDSLRRPSTLQDTAKEHDRPRPALWSYWRFSAEQLEDLKKVASSGSTWVSTNDALTAFLAQRVTAVRLKEGRVAADDIIQLQRAVDSRSILTPPIEDGYLGHLVALADNAWQSPHELCDASLADIAVQIRESLAAVDDHFIRSLATLIHATEDKTTIFYGSINKPGRDVLCSSWAQLGWLYSCDFGPCLGAPAIVRRPRLLPVPDLSYIMPKDGNGAMHIATCLFHEDFVGLVNDDVWRQRASLVG